MPHGIVSNQLGKQISATKNFKARAAMLSKRCYGKIAVLTGTTTQLIVNEEPPVLRQWLERTFRYSIIQQQLKFTEIAGLLIENRLSSHRKESTSKSGCNILREDRYELL